MAGIREAKKRKTRKAIIAAAVTLFAEKGYEKTSIEQLARQAGIGKSTVYTYFASKSEIFLAFCEDELEFVTKELSRQCNKSSSLLDQLLTLFMGEYRFVTKNKDFGRILLREMIFPRELTVEKSNELDNRYLELLTSMFKESQKKGELRCDVELLFAIGHFYGLYLMTMSAWYSGRLQTDEDVYESLKIFFKQALAGLAPTGT